MRVRAPGAWIAKSLPLALMTSALVRAQTLPADANAAAPFGAPIEDQRLYAHALLDQFEGRFGGGNNELRWDGEAWVGTDSNRLWLKSEGLDAAGKTEDGQQQVLYSRPISTYFDLQAGLRYDLDSGSGRGWAALGVEGLAPFFFKLSATAYASDEGHYAAEVMVSYEQLLTQRFIVEPEVELNAYTRADPARGLGAGLCDLDAGLRLRYEFSRKVAPYLGLVYERKSGGSSLAGERIDAVRLAIGLRAWL